MRAVIAPPFLLVSLMLTDNGKTKRVEPRIALSILISSSFLQMAHLEDLCLRYIHDNLDEVLKGMNLHSKILEIFSPNILWR